MLTPVSEATNRIRYQLRHHDLMGDFPTAWGVVVRAGLVVTPADVSPELVTYIRRHIATLHPYDRSGDAERFRDIQPVTQSA